MFVKRLAAIIALVALVTVGCSRYALEEPKDRSYNQEIASKLYVPLDEYFADYNTYPEKLSQLVPNYISEIPKTASGNDFQYHPTPITGEPRNRLAIYWYQRNLSDGAVIACSVGRSSNFRGEERFKHNDCWRLGQGDH